MSSESDSFGRREVLGITAAVVVGGITSIAVGEEKRELFNEGKVGEFDFLAGEWKIANRRLKDETANEWDEFEGEATCWSILNGQGSIEELRIPARQFAGMGLRLLDVKKKQWQDFWVNARSGELTGPGTPGHFVDGAGIFESEEKDGENTIRARGIWDQITEKSCRWRQAVSRDDGKTWQENWVMHWTRVEKKSRTE